MSQLEGSAFMYPPPREEVQRGAQQCCVLGYISDVKRAGFLMRDF